MRGNHKYSLLPDNFIGVTPDAIGEREKGVISQSASEVLRPEKHGRDMLRGVDGSIDFQTFYITG